MSYAYTAWMNRAVLVGIHAGCLLALWTGVSWSAAIVCFLAYVIRGFAITAGYHRYFSHRSFKTSRFGQFCLALLGISAVQGGPLKWPREHRHHHKESDQPRDLHSPKHPSFWWSHMGWFLTSEEPQVDTNVKDLEQYPELVWAERLQGLVIIAYAAGMVFLGRWLGADYGTSGLQMLAWGFFISTVITWHITWSVNSFTHTFGSRRFETEDDSRNNWIVGILALGEGHHNNHHAHQGVCRQGLLWWEIDVTYYGLKVLERLGLVWDLNEPEPESFTVAAKLGELRGELKRRRLPDLDIRQRIKVVQELMATAVRTAARARKTANELFEKQKISAADKLAQIQQAADSFAQSMRQAETTALA